MLNLLRNVATDYDAIFFTPHDKEDDAIEVRSVTYKEKGNEVGGTEMGHFYDIVLFRLSDEYDMTDLDKFSAILVDPRVYISRMIKDDWYGLVAKKTTTSDRFVKDVFDKWASV
jgi:hypothetical protein